MPLSLKAPLGWLGNSLARLSLGIGTLVLAGAAGCGDGTRSQGAGDGPGVNPTPADPCATPNAGCPCETPGEFVDCGVEKRRNESYVTCETGSRQCSAGTWQECVTSGRFTTQSIRDPLSTKYVQGLGATASCANENLCDPFCTKVEDDTNALPIAAGDDVVVTPGGLTLVQNALPAPTIPCTSLAIAPNPATLTVTQLSPVSPNQVQLTASVVRSDCYPGTPPVLWAIDRFDLAVISSTGLVTLVSPTAGPITVTAYAGALAATARLNVRVNILDTSSAPAGSAAAYPVTTGMADTLQVLYPYADTVFPLGLLPPLLQWATGSVGAASSVKVTLRYPPTGTAIFSWSKIVAENSTLSLNPPTNSITLAAGPRAAFPNAAWEAFEQSARGNVAALIVQRVVPATLRAQVSTSIKFATGQLKGTVYYQSYGTNLVQNYSSTLAAQTIGGGARFGAATLAIRPGNTFPAVAAGYTSATDGPGCRVCHSASANGTTLVSNIFGGADSSLFRLGVDPANGGTPFAALNNGRYAWPALYPDGTFLFSSSGPPIAYSTTPPPGALDGGDNGAFVNALYSTASASFGNLIASTGIPAGLHAALPVFSPDGTKVAFNHYSGTVGAVVGDKRSLGMLNFNAATKAFSGFRRLVTEPTTACSASFGTTDPCTNVWPSFLPSGGGAVYQREIFNNGRVPGSNHADFGGTRSGCDGSGLCGDNGTRGELWWVTTAATPVKARLNRANGLTSASAVYLPVQTHTGNLNGVCENGETCAEYNPAAGGNDNWACEAGETCLEYNLNGDKDGICETGEICAEWNAAGGGDNDGVCETGETCQERNAATGGDNDNRCESGETCQEAAGDGDYLCETGEVCAEDQASHTALNEPVLNYEPNVNPQAVGGYNWVVFTSRRLFGNVATMNPWWSDPRFKPIGGQFGPTTKKIWVSALNETPTSGGDPSHPAFYLPGQEYLSGNSKGFWVLDPCKVASASRTSANVCDTSLDCCGAPTTAACSLQTPIANPAVRHCIPLGAAGCIADGAAMSCTSHAECCGFATGSRCANGACAAPPPLLVYGPGTYVRDFQAECGPGKLPTWQVFQWQAQVPSGTSIEFTAASARTVAALSSAPVVDAGLATTSTAAGTWVDNPINLNQELTAGDAGSQEYLRITMLLTPTADSLTAPTLEKWRVIYDCFDAL